MMYSIPVSYFHSVFLWNKKNLSEPDQQPNETNNHLGDDTKNNEHKLLLALSESWTAAIRNSNKIVNYVISSQNGGYSNT